MRGPLCPLRSRNPSALLNKVTALDAAGQAGAVLMPEPAGGPDGPLPAPTAASAHEWGKEGEGLQVQGRRGWQAGQLSSCS